MLRIGVVGCGVIHGTHCDAIQKIEGAKLAAVCDVVKDRAKAAGEKYGVPGFASLGKMLEQVDAVTVCVPSGLHHKIGIKAAQAGKHVLTEKPIDVNYRQAKALVDACRAAKVCLGVVSQHRFSNDIRALRDAAQGGDLGKLLMGDAYIKWYRTQAYYDSGDWRGTWKLDGGGCLMNQGVHYIDMLQWVMGGVKSVQAVTRTAAHKIEVEDLAYALVEFKNGAVGLIHGSTSTYPGFGERLEVHGTCGTAIIEGDRFKVYDINPDAPKDKSPYGKGVQKQPTGGIKIYDKSDETATGASDPSAIWGEQHRLQIEDWVRAIERKTDPYMTGEMAIEPLKVILAIYKSARSGGRKVEVGAIG